MPSSAEGFARVTQFGYGLEIDIRLRDGELVIAHDHADVEAATRISELLSLLEPGQLLLLNVKEDGLATELAGIQNALLPHTWFAFDMSVPQTLQYRDAHLPWLGRLSPYESGLPELEPSGYLLDFLDRPEWLRTTTSVKRDSTVFMIAPELHGLDPWDAETCGSFHEKHPHVSVVTDYPEIWARV